MDKISFDDFLKVELRIGKVVKVEPFPEARKPAYILHVDFGDELGVRKSSALVTGFHNESGHVALCVPDRPVPLGSRLL